ncbi:recombinase RecT [Streptomyces sp. NPDC006261]|uniref:recombinase RecT n=1 Tax=Streptomyces sp. NPDC006261 TaxID=3156739 RepID=UPI0033BC8FF7
MTTAARNAVARRAENVGAVQQNENQKPTLAQQIERMKPELARALPKHMSADRMARIALTLIRKNPELANCTTESFLGALMTCSQLGFEPGSPTQEAFIVPYKGEATFQLGYQGMVTLFYQHPMASSIKVETVREHDYFEHEEGLEEKLIHRPCKTGPRGKAIAYYSVARLVNGGRTFKVMYPTEIEERRQKLPSKNSPAWRNSFDEMAKKTVLRNHFKALPKSAELARAMANDDTVRTDANPDVIDVPPDYLNEPAPAAITAGDDQWAGENVNP